MASIDYTDYKTLNPKYGKQTEKFLNEQCPHGVDNCPLRENELFPCLYKYKIIKKKRIRAATRGAYVRLTDLKIDSECKVEFRFQTISGKLNQIAMIAGNRNSGLPFGFWINSQGGSSRNYSFPGTASGKLYSYNFSSDVDYRATLDKNGFWVNDVLVASTTPPAEVASCTSSAWLNVCNDGGGVYGYNEHWVYHIKVWRSGELIRSFVAAYSEKLEKFGFYDEVNDIFYPSSNSSAQFTDAEP